MHLDRSRTKHAAPQSLHHASAAAHRTSRLCRPCCRGDLEAVRHLARSGLDVFAHNLETVGWLGSRGTARAGRTCSWAQCTSVRTQPPLFHMQHIPPSVLTSLPLPPTSQQVERLQRRVRDPRAGYFQSLGVLRAAKECGVYTQSSLMLGLGERLCWGCFGSLVPAES